MTQNNPGDKNKIPPDLDENALESGLRAALHRQDCPETVELGQYQLNLLSAPEAARLSAHLEHCPHCRAELRRLTEFLAEDIPVPASVSVKEDSEWIPGDGFQWREATKTGQIIIQILEKALNTAIANLQQKLRPPTVDFILAGPSRGSQPLLEMSLEVGIEDFEVHILLETKGDNPAYCKARVEIDLPSRGGWPNLAAVEVALMKNDLMVDKKATDQFGHAVFERVPIDDLTQLNFVITIPSQS